MSYLSLSSAMEYTEFWISFWAAIISGIIYSIITGIIVGIAVWRIQLGREMRDKKHAIEQELERIKSKLRIIIDKPDAIHVDSVEGSLPPAAENIMSVLTDHPIKIEIRF